MANTRRVKLKDIAQEDKVIITSEYPNIHDLPYLGLEQIESQTGEILSDIPPSEGVSNTYAFDSSHILYGKLRPYLNKVALPQYQGRCSTELIPLRPINVDRKYLGFLLRSPKIVAAAMEGKTGSRMPRADMKLLMNFDIEIAKSRSDQSTIALSLESQLNEVKKARDAHYTQLSEINFLRSKALSSIFLQISGSPKKKLGDFSACVSGSTPARGNKRYWGATDIPWVKTGEVAFSAINETEEYISYAALKECSVKLLPPKTVLIAMYGQGKTRGQSAILEVEATTNQACFAIPPNDTWEPEYLFHWLRYSYQSLRALSKNRGGNQSNLNGGILKELEIPAPPRVEQLELVKEVNIALSLIDEMQSRCRQSLADIHQLPQQIITQAFETQ